MNPQDPQPQTQAAPTAYKRRVPTLGNVAAVIENCGMSELVQVQPVQGQRNFQIQPIIQSGGPTPWTQTPDWKKIELLHELALALDKAGFAFPEERDAEGKVVHEFESVWTSLRLSRQNVNRFQPRLFVNAQRFNREIAQRIAQTRRIAQEGSAEQQQALIDALDPVIKGPDVDPGEGSSAI